VITYRWYNTKYSIYNCSYDVYVVENYIFLETFFNEEELCNVVN